MISEGASAAASMGFYSNALEGQESKDPEKVAGMFEALFYRELLKTVRDGDNKDPLFDSFEMKQVQAMYDDEFATHMGTMGHLGISDMVLESIEDQINPQALAAHGLGGKEKQPVGLLKAPTIEELAR